MKIIIVLTILFFYYPIVYSQANTKLIGTVFDKNTSLPLKNANIIILELNLKITSNVLGKFEVNNLTKSSINITITYSGYLNETFNLLVKENVINKFDFYLTEKDFYENEIVISASRKKEKITYAPSTISVINAADFKKLNSFNTIEPLSKVLGIDFVRSGVNGMALNARGFNTAFNAKVLSLTDGRNSMLAGSSGLPSGILNTVIKEDIDRMEIVLGPHAALYGPNAHNGIVNTITKDARKWQGTDVVVSFGNQNVFSGRFRNAMKLNDKWAYKITGEFTSGNDYQWYDSIYAGGTIYGPNVVIAEKVSNFKFQHKRVGAQLYYNFNDRSDIEISYGGSLNDFIGVNGLGRNQMRGMTFSFLNLKFNSPNFFAQVYESSTNLGTSYSIANYTRDYWNRTNSTITNPNHPLYASNRKLSSDSAEIFALRLGNMYKEESKRYNAEVQYNFELKKAELNIITNASFQKDLPRTYGTVLIDGNDKIQTHQFGVVTQVEKKLFKNYKFIAAARLDYHSFFGNMFSPKFSLMNFNKFGSIRLSWAKAFAIPIMQFQSGSTLGYVFGNGNGITYIPNGSDINNSSQIAVTTSFKPEEIQTLEFGIKGKITKKLYIDFSTYYNTSTNFLSPLITAGGRALKVGDITINTPLLVPGTVTNNILNGAAFNSYFNYGRVASYGIDVATNYFFTKNINLIIKYSWFDSDITNNDLKNDANKDGYVSLEERSLNAPRNKFNSTISFQNMFNGKMYLNFSVRYVEKYNMYSGNQISTEAGKGKRGIVYGGTNPLNNQPRNYIKNFDWGNLGGFTTCDLNTGFNLNETFSIGVGVINLFNTEQREFVGSPTIERIFSFELKTHISN